MWCRQERMTMTLGTATVMGAGAWGTAMAKVLADAGTDVRLWARGAAVADEVNTAHSNDRYLPGITLPTRIRATTDPAEALDGVTTVLLGVPSQTLRANLESWRPHLAADATLVSLAKGIELSTCMRMSQVIVAVTGCDSGQIAVVSGPNLADEIADEQPAATVVACQDSGRAVALQRALNTGYLRPYTNSDVVGTEIGGACKNVIALACGMAAGVGLGENTAAAIITRGLAEIMRLGIALPASQHWPVWPGSVTWSPPARRRIPATAPSGSASAAATHWHKPSAPATATSPRGSPPARRSWHWHRATTSRCHSPKRCTGCATRDYRSTKLSCCCWAAAPNRSSRQA
jgi:glycerol-3-phosphate dehydrogenase